MMYVQCFLGDCGYGCDHSIVIILTLLLTTLMHHQLLLVPFGQAGRIDHNGNRDHHIVEVCDLVVLQ